METYKFLVHDEENKILDKLFDIFEDAFDYAQNGLTTHIDGVPFVDGVEDKDGDV